VIVIAFIAQRLISPPESERGDPTYSAFIAQVERQPDTIARVTLFTEDAEAEVQETNGDEYETGYPPESEVSLVNTLRRQGIETVVDSDRGGSLVGLLTYVLPYVIFFGFFMWLVGRMQRDRPAATTWHPDRLRAVVAAESAEDAEAILRTRLQAVGEYRVGPTRLR
jgi:cell division protease FtsH